MYPVRIANLTCGSNSMHPQLPSGKSLSAYTVALLTAIATFYLHRALSDAFGEGLLLILFLFPILITSLLGSGGSCLAATLLVAAFTAWLIPPDHSFAMTASYDFMQWCLLIASGVLLSILSASLHRSRQHATDGWQQLAAIQGLLQECETRFQGTFEQAAMGIALIATDGHWLWVNRKLCELVGYRQEELLQLTFQDITHPDDLQADLGQVRRMLAGEIQSYSMEKRCICKDGSLVWVNLTVALVRKPNAIPDYFISIVENIQARKQAETILLTNELSYRSLFENMLNGYAHCLMLYDNGEPQDFVYLEVNKAFEVQTGLTDVVGRKVSEIIPNIREADSRIFEIYGRVAQNGQPECFETYVQALRMWFSVSVYCPQWEHFVAVFDVITERKQAELALRDSEQRFRQLFDLMPVPLGIVNQTGEVVAVNNRFVADFGYTRVDVPTLTEWWPLAYPDPDYRRWVMDTWNTAVQQAAEQNADIKPMEYRLTCKDGSMRTVVISGIIIDDDVLATFFDVTKRKKAEAELRCSNDELERFNLAMVGRELNMIALKQQVNDLSRQLGQSSPYPLAFLDTPSVQPKGNNVP